MTGNNVGTIADPIAGGTPSVSELRDLLASAKEGKWADAAPEKPSAAEKQPDASSEEPVKATEEQGATEKIEEQVDPAAETGRDDKGRFKAKIPDELQPEVDRIVSKRVRKE